MVKYALVLILFIFSVVQTQGQNIGLKTNLLYLGTTTPNLGVEIVLSKKYTLNISGGYNAWLWNSGMSLRHVLVQPEGRYWFDKAFEGHFVGLHAHYAKYNAGEIPFIAGMKDYMYRGRLYGGGLSYGYHFALGGRWGLELNLGLGYAYTEYNKYRCAECAELVGRYKRHYFGPTKAAASIIFLID